MTTIANSAGAISPSFKPFSLVDNRVLKCAKEIGVVGVAVYNVLASYADNRTRICWPGEETVADVLGLARETVSRTIRRLESAGLVSVQRRLGRSSVYRLVDADQGRDPGSRVGCDPGSRELDVLPNYTQEQQQAPALEQPAQPEPVAVVVVSSNQENIPQESAENPPELSETETLAETLPLPKSSAVRILERAPADERRAIVETFNAARASRSILKPAAYLAALVQAAIIGTFTPEAAQQAKREQESRRRNSEALERSNAEMERRALERLGLASSSGAVPGNGPPRPGPGASRVSALRAALRGGVGAAPVD